MHVLKKAFYYQYLNVNKVNRPLLISKFDCFVCWNLQKLELLSKEKCIKNCLYLKYLFLKTQASRQGLGMVEKAKKIAKIGQTPGAVCVRKCKKFLKYVTAKKNQKYNNCVCLRTITDISCPLFSLSLSHQQHPVYRIST